MTHAAAEPTAAEPTVDELLDRYITAWHAGDAPSAAVSVELASEPHREELRLLLAAFLELAPTVDVTPAAASAKADDPLVARIAALEGSPLN